LRTTDFRRRNGVDWTPGAWRRPSRWRPLPTSLSPGVRDPPAACSPARC